MKLLLPFILLSTTTSFQIPTPSKARTQPLKNVPLPSIEGGATPEEIKKAADKIPPPSSFYELQIASVRAAEDAMRDGFRLLEVEVSVVCAYLVYLCEW
jgi:hypothetical protein